MSEALYWLTVCDEGQQADLDFNMALSRRLFMKGALACSSVAALRSQTLEGKARIEIVPSEPIATIAPEIYGHFIEHLGGVIYDGVWVGADSKIPNTGGIRQAVIDALRAIKAPVIRWPGGCFADSYDWRDGLGPTSARKRRPNFWGNSDSNTFGTQEFMRLCDLAGAKPYLAANLRSLPAKDFYEWVEYSNAPEGSSEGAILRARDGHAAPFNVRYWGVGNESWGCGGNFLPEDYASEFRRFTAWTPQFGGKLAFIASGPSDFDVDWTRRLMRSMHEKRAIGNIFGLSTHYYTWNLSGGKTTDWDQGKGDALRFGDFEWYELLAQGSLMEKVIQGHWSTLAEFDPGRTVKLVVDEWGAWYRPGTEIGPKYALSQTITLRDALLSGITLDTFHRNADKVAMANAAQLVNCLHSLMMASEDHFALTPVYHVFKMYTEHMGAQAVRAEFFAPSVSYDRNGTPASLAGLSGSASISGKQMTLTVVNPRINESIETEIVVRGAAVRDGSALVLTNPDIHAHNDFIHPGAVIPVQENVRIAEGKIVYAFPRASVTSLRFALI